MFEEIAEQQGWNADTMLGLVMEFITANGLGEQLGEFAQERAEEENAGAKTTWEAMTGEEKVQAVASEDDE
jgi:hypothetical protein